jgi:hypothetical protein
MKYIFESGSRVLMSPHTIPVGFFKHWKLIFSDIPLYAYTYFV